MQSGGMAADELEVGTPHQRAISEDPEIPVHFSIHRFYKKPMKISLPFGRNTRLFLTWLPVIAFIAWSLWWSLLARELRHGLQNWVEARRAEGWVVTTGETTLGGFPTMVRLTLGAPSLKTMDGSGWQGPQAMLSLSPLDPKGVRLELHGKQVLVPPGQPPVEAFAAEVALMLYPDSLDFSLRAGELRGRKLGRLAFHAKPEGSLLPGLSAWRNGGGDLQLSQINVDWDSLHLEGEGTLALDKRLQPLFAGTASMAGLPETLDKLAQDGTIKPAAAALAHVGLKLIAKPGADGRAEVHLPVTVQDGKIYLGPASVASLPDITWPNSVYFRNE